MEKVVGRIYETGYKRRRRTRADNKVLGLIASYMEANFRLNERAESLMQEERWFDAIALIESESSHEIDYELERSQHIKHQ